MFDLFKFFLNSFACQKNGVCTKSPVIRALNAVIIDEIRQIAFYIIKLKEFNIINHEIAKEAVLSLSLNIADVDFDKKAFKFQYEKIKEIRIKAEKFYIEKARELNAAYESIEPIHSLDYKKADITNLIKAGEEIISRFQTTSKEKSSLIELVVLIAQTASNKIKSLLYFKNDVYEYCFETLNFLGLINNLLTRDEKFIKRIKEFSDILYKINEEIAYERRLKWGERKTSVCSTSIFQGKSILVTGGGLEELYELLVQTENKNINVYTDTSLVTCFSYPEFKKFGCLKGLYGLSEDGSDFSDFKGVIFVCENSDRQLGSIFRGKIYSSKPVAFEHAIKIRNCNFEPLINDALQTEGFSRDIEGEKIEFFFDKIAFEAAATAENKNVLLTAGVRNKNVEEKFKDCIKIDFFPPDETEVLYAVSEVIEAEKLSVYFSICTKNSIATLLSLLNKNLKIYISNCRPLEISPNITESLKENFSVYEI